jgi:hypothetical protein
MLLEKLGAKFYEDPKECEALKGVYASLDRDECCVLLLYVFAHASTCNSMGATDAINGYF